jgi:hypothetical protein
MSRWALTIPACLAVAGCETHVPDEVLVSVNVYNATGRAGLGPPVDVLAVVQGELRDDPRVAYDDAQTKMGQIDAAGTGGPLRVELMVPVPGLVRVTFLDTATLFEIKNGACEVRDSMPRTGREITLEGVASNRLVICNSAWF